MHPNLCGVGSDGRNGIDATQRFSEPRLRFDRVVAGQPILPRQASFLQLVEAKRSLPNRLTELLPDDVLRNELLLNFCKRLIATDPTQRFPQCGRMRN